MNTCSMILGFLVLIPDYYRGKMKDPTEDGLVEFLAAETDWSKLRQDWEGKIAPYAKEHGAKIFGTVGEFHRRKLLPHKKRWPQNDPFFEP